MRLILCFTVLLLAGCQAAQMSSEVAPGAVGVCTSCGQIKGTDVCCNPDAPMCSKCDLAKGSPGCCRIEKGSTEPISICTKCGQFKGTDACCQPGAAACTGCGLAKGSPGCCKLDMLDG